MPRNEALTLETKTATRPAALTVALATVDVDDPGAVHEAAAGAPEWREAAAVARAVCGVL